MVSTASVISSGPKPLADDLADGCLFVAGAAQRDLVEFGALLLDPQNADMADMVMAAGVDAAGNLDLELADLLLPLLIGEAGGDLLRDGNRAGIGQRAIVEAGAGDDVGDEPGIAGGEPDLGKSVEQRGQVGARDMRQDQVLLVGNPNLVGGERLGEIGNRVHLVGAGIARHLADPLQRDGHAGIVGMAVRRHVVAHPGVEAARRHAAAAPVAPRRRRGPAATAARNRRRSRGCRTPAASARRPSASRTRLRSRRPALPFRFRGPGS